jgi:hypothetical protein
MQINAIQHRRRAPGRGGQAQARDAPARARRCTPPSPWLASERAPGAELVLRERSRRAGGHFTRSSPTFAASLADGLNRAAEKRPRQHCQACDRRFLFTTAMRDPEGHAGGPMISTFLPLWSSKVSLRKWIRRVGLAPVAQI